METALNVLIPLLDSAAVRESAHAARLAYEEAIDCDGVSAAAWQAIADDMHATADALEAIGALRGVVQCHRDRASDASSRATYARRMLVVARNSGRVIDMASIGGAS